ncbi:hypothetical protein HDU85_002390 [Gaertneriomyces sp. JEL0708]|nr:hypothetical protein HDU85_002390 [Gaertneriomyces sp. JEL0708]
MGYDPIRVFYCPEYDCDLQGFSVVSPESFLGGRLFEAVVVDTAEEAFTPLRSTINGCTHEILSDLALLAIKAGAINETALLADKIGTASSRSRVSHDVTDRILVPSLSVFSRPESRDVAAVGYPGAMQMCRPQEDGSDFNQIFQGRNPLSYPSLRLYFGNGNAMKAGLGTLPAFITNEGQVDHDGFSIVASTGAGMSGGPVVDVHVPGTIIGVVVGSATCSPRSHLMDRVYNLLHDCDRASPEEFTCLEEELGNIVSLPRDIMYANDYVAREEILRFCDRLRGRLQNGQQFTVEELNYNHALGAGGISFSYLYLRLVLPFVDRSRLTAVQRTALNEYVGWATDHLRSAMRDLNLR